MKDKEFWWLALDKEEALKHSNYREGPDIQVGEVYEN